MANNKIMKMFSKELQNNQVVNFGYCPKCRSTNISEDKDKKGWKCLKCGHNFKEPLRGYGFYSFEDMMGFIKEINDLDNN